MKVIHLTYPRDRRIKLGVGAVISHILPNGSEKTIAQASSTVMPPIENYSQMEKVALAIIYAVKKFQKFVYGRRFTLLTDHKPLLSIFSSKKGVPIHSANRLQRWGTTIKSSIAKPLISSKLMGCLASSTANAHRMKEPSSQALQWWMVYFSYSRILFATLPSLQMMNV